MPIFRRRAQIRSDDRTPSRAWLGALRRLPSPYNARHVYYGERTLLSRRKRRLGYGRKLRPSIALSRLDGISMEGQALYPAQERAPGGIDGIPDKVCSALGPRRYATTISLAPARATVVSVPCGTRCLSGTEPDIDGSNKLCWGGEAGRVAGGVVVEDSGLYVQAAAQGGPSSMAELGRGLKDAG